MFQGWKIGRIFAVPDKITRLITRVKFEQISHPEEKWGKNAFEFRQHLNHPMVCNLRLGNRRLSGTPGSGISRFPVPSNGVSSPPLGAGGPAPGVQKACLLNPLAFRNHINHILTEIDGIKRLLRWTVAGLCLRIDSCPLVKLGHIEGG